ncbi:hypothetical protein GCM10011491_44670 [Brucella endophytica]|uniref:Uncharacterized protein n=1 Tax=Brucella endophytica TaxID=1963359 RepID=A0A916WLK8_9HYPH|nr:hypothetical protein GCM10011491_44670 [Brucella endophytica]
MSVKVSGYMERIGAPGGFNGMVKGATFTGQGKTIKITITGAANEGGESPARPATLVYERACWALGVRPVGLTAGRNGPAGCSSAELRLPSGAY